MGSRVRNVVIGRRLSITIDVTAVIYSHTVRFNRSEAGRLSGGFNKDSTTRDGGAKGADAPKEGAVIGLASLGVNFYPAGSTF